MGFLDFLKKDAASKRPVSPIVSPQAPAQPLLGSETLSDAPPAPDAFLNDLVQKHDPADDLFSVKPTPQAPAPPPVRTPPQDLFAPLPEAAHEHSMWTSDAEPAVGAPPASAAPVVPSTTNLPDFSDDDIEALERIQVEAVTPPQPLPTRQPPVERNEEIAKEIDVLLAPAPKPIPAPSYAPAQWSVDPERLPMPVVEDALPRFDEPAKDANGFLATQDYLAIIDALRQSRRVLRKCDESVRDALTNHELMDAQYARAAADIANIEDRLRAADAALFGEGEVTP